MDEKALAVITQNLRKPICIEQSFFAKPFQNPIVDPARPEVGKFLSAPLLAVPDGYKMVDVKPMLDAFRDTPERRKGVAKFDTADAFIFYVNRYKGADTVLFASCGQANGHIQAVFDYHPAGTDQEKAGWGAFKATYEFPTSEAFQVWSKFSGRPMNMKDFAAFLEDRIPDLGVEVPNEIAGGPPGYICEYDLRSLNPTYALPSQVLALADGITVNMRKKYGQHQRLATGEHKIEFSEDHDDATTKKGYTITVPQFFLLDIPVFEDGPRSLIPVRLRYNVDSDNGITWRFDVWNVVQIFAAEFRKEVTKITGQTTLPQFFGTP